MIALAILLVVAIFSGVLGSGYLAVHRIRRGTKAIEASVAQSRFVFRRELAGEPLESLVERVHRESSARGWPMDIPDPSETGLRLALDTLAASLSPDQQPAFDEVGGLADVAAALAMRTPPSPGDAGAS